MEKELQFIKADISHIDVVFKWANDVTTRQNAFNTNQIPYEDHIKWYTEKINDKDVFFFICKQDDINVGQLRIDFEDNNATISYSVDKDYRGKGFGKKIIQYAEVVVREYCKDHSLCIELIGKVKRENLVSQKCFLTQEFDREDFDEYIEFKKRVL